jgi:hypothetical protein
MRPGVADHTARLCSVEIRVFRAFRAWERLELAALGRIDPVPMREERRPR